ncbi:MAG: hypothetical protein K6E92_10960 [Lachnospiraceae bacterium]|nr:hypothetical protein [Lachnospiraceae bacterium]
MPPSRHSSSSHSSRSHSSSSRSHSSSHSSSRSHSSSYSRSSSHSSGSRSYSSGPSRHSGSSHSSATGSRSAGGSVSRATRLHTLRRTRSNQPSGWDRATNGEPVHYSLRHHDYIYYPHSWIDESGTSHEEGYYDENGVGYENIVAPGVETVLHCRACGAHRLYTWTDGTLPACDKCGAAYEISFRDEMPEDLPAATGRRKPENVIAMVLTVICILVISAFGMLGIRLAAARVISDRMERWTETDTRTDSGITNPLYVEAIGRDCYLDGENYYDPETDCWFWYNEDLSPGQWQYWYEGISSDYGDYGWMEYDDAEGKWYIEISDGQWIALPDRYDTSGLWHFPDAYIP